MNEDTPHEVALYMAAAHESLQAARLALTNDFYTAAINRAYYAIFYAANAVLATQKLARGKHSGVLAAFRQYFIKTEKLPLELSEIYGRVMEDRQEGDYDLLSPLSKEDATFDLEQAEHFVEVIQDWLREQPWQPHK